MKTQTVVPAAPGYFVLCFIDGDLEGEHAPSFERVPVIAWHIETEPNTVAEKRRTGLATTANVLPITHQGIWHELSGPRDLLLRPDGRVEWCNGETIFGGESEALEWALGCERARAA